MDYVPSHRGATLLSICGVFEALAITAVILRLWSRRIKKVGLYLNDYAILVALFFSSGIVAVIITGVYLAGLGQHTNTLNEKQLITFGKLDVVTSPVWVSAVTAVKISMLHLYIVIFRNVAFIRCCYVIIALSLGFWTSVMLESFLLCRPLAYNWDPELPHTCGNVKAAYLAAHIINLLMDVSIIALPMPVLWNLKMQTSKKIGISIMFGIGIIICIVSICRLLFVSDIFSPDPTYGGAILEYFSILEPMLGIVVACLPVLRPAVGKITSATMAGTLITTPVATLTNNHLNHHTHKNNNNNNNKTLNATTSTTTMTRSRHASSSLSSPARNGHFHRLNESYAPTCPYGAHATATAGESLGLEDLDLDLESGGQERRMETKEMIGGIKVTRTWCSHSE